MKLTNSIFAPRDWGNKLKNAQFEAGFEQSAQWGKLLQTLEGAKPQYLIVRKATDDLIAALQVVHRLPWNRKKNARDRNLRHFITGKTQGWLQWGGGPVFFNSEIENNLEALQMMILWMDDYCAKHKLASIRGSLSRTSQFANSELIKNHFEQSGYKTKTWASLLVDLNQDEEILWKKLKPAARKSVNRAKREGLRIEKISSLLELQEKFAGPYNSFEVAAGRKALPWRNYESTWKSDKKGRYQFFCAIDTGDRILAVLAVHIFNQVATEVNSAINPVAFSEKIPAQDLLHWNIMLDMKSQDFKIFDLAGINPNPLDKAALGIRRFKEKWGGEYVEQHRFSKNSRTGLIPRLLNKMK